MQLTLRPRSYRLAGIAPGLVFALAWPQPAPEPLEPLLTRVGAYALRYEASVAALVAEERYDQRYFTPHEKTPTESRLLLSEVLIVRLPLDVHWLMYRDVLAVDGRPVTAERGRLERLFRDSPGSAADQAQALLRESSRFNVGPVERNFNIPTLALVFLLPDNQRRLSVSSTKTEQLAGRSAVVLTAKETARPTLVRSRGLDTPLALTYWVDPNSGAVLQTEVRFVSPANGSRAWLRSTFAWSDKETLWLPSEMTERYDLRTAQESIDSRYYVEGHATYGNVRRFEVTTQEQIRVP